MPFEAQAIPISFGCSALPETVLRTEDLPGRGIRPIAGSGTRPRTDARRFRWPEETALPVPASIGLRMRTTSHSAVMLAPVLRRSPACPAYPKSATAGTADWTLVKWEFAGSAADAGMVSYVADSSTPPLRQERGDGANPRASAAR